MFDLRRLLVVFSVALLALSGCGGDSGPAGSSCDGDDPNFDVSGVYMERYNCAEAGSCVDPDIMTSISITAINAITGQYEFSDPDSDWAGTGLLCGTTMIWNASTDDYTESGVWTFSDDSNFVKTSDYDYRMGGGGGTCTGTASRSGSPPAPAPVGNCD